MGRDSLPRGGLSRDETRTANAGQAGPESPYIF
jgi:hypothetical protein